MNAEICHITMAFAQHLFWKTYSFPPCTCFSKTAIHMSSQQMKSWERQWLREYLKCYMSRFTARQNNGSQDLKKQRSVLVIHLLLAQQTRTGWTTTPTQVGTCWNADHLTALLSNLPLSSLLSSASRSCPVPWPHLWPQSQRGQLTLGGPLSPFPGNSATPPRSPTSISVCLSGL